MVKITVLQADNRPQLDYLLLSKLVNQKYCEYLGYKYQFIEIEPKYYEHMHPATSKIFVVNDFLQTTDAEIILFLDSDAWIQNPVWLNQIVGDFMNKENKHGCFSRDPPHPNNTFINSGSFMIKNDQYVKKMYETLVEKLTHVDLYKWPYDQIYMSRYIFDNKKEFIIYTCNILNTPHGIVLKHNWWKNDMMREDLNFHVNSGFEFPDTVFSIEQNLDAEEFYGNFHE